MTPEYLEFLAQKAPKPLASGMGNAESGAVDLFDAA